MFKPSMIYVHSVYLQIESRCDTVNPMGVKGIYDQTMCEDVIINLRNMDASKRL